MIKLSKHLSKDNKAVNKLIEIYNANKDVKKDYIYYYMKFTDRDGFVDESYTKIFKDMTLDSVLSELRINYDLYNKQLSIYKNLGGILSIKNINFDEFTHLSKYKNYFDKHVTNLQMYIALNFVDEELYHEGLMIPE